MDKHKKVELAFKIVSSLPRERHPRIGGSCALYIYGITDDFDDIDIIVDDIRGISLPYKIVPPKHKHKMNAVISYMNEDGIKVDLITRITALVNTKKEFVEPPICVKEARVKLHDYVLKTYNEEVEKWK